MRLGMRGDIEDEMGDWGSDGEIWNESGVWG